ncbi:hypothetical protein ROZALSC1DRAFT_30448, partial [Rozella allomycis CSF55]
MEDLLAKILKEPENHFLQSSEEAANTFVSYTKKLYDQKQEHMAFGPLKELYTENLDENQIWEMIELMNKPCLSFLNEKVESLKLADADESECESDENDSQEELQSDIGNEIDDMDKDSEVDDDQDVDEVEEDDIDIRDFDDQAEEELDLNKNIKNKENRKPFKSINSFDDLDRLAEEQEEFYDQNENDLENEDDSELDSELEDEEDLDADEIGYKEFYEDNKIKLFDEDEDEKQDEMKSSFEKHQERMNKMIADLEKENVSEKPWTMIGEVTSKVRPENSLLEEVVEFDQTKPVPEISEEVARSLEDIIKQRIIQNAFDDVQRRYEDVKPVSTELDEVSQEKSKESLAQLYEEDFKKKNNSEYKSEADKKLEKEKFEIKALFNELTQKLDALSNFNFTPRQ